MCLYFTILPPGTGAQPPLLMGQALAEAFLAHLAVSNATNTTRSGALTAHSQLLGAHII